VNANTQAGILVIQNAIASAIAQASDTAAPMFLDLFSLSLLSTLILFLLLTMQKLLMQIPKQMIPRAKLEM
jgi:hypothetical protein